MLSFIHHRVKSQNASMGHMFQCLPFSGFMPICNECFGGKHTFVQKGDYLDVHSGSSFVVAITWHLVNSVSAISSKKLPAAM